MKKIIQFLIMVAIAGSIHTASAQIIKLNFDPNPYLGTWETSDDKNTYRVRFYVTTFDSSLEGLSEDIVGEVSYFRKNETLPYKKIGYLEGQEINVINVLGKTDSAKLVILYMDPHREVIGYINFKMLSPTTATWIIEIDPWHMSALNWEGELDLPEKATFVKIANGKPYVTTPTTPIPGGEHERRPPEPDLPAQLY